MTERWFSEGIELSLYSGKSDADRKNQEMKRRDGNLTILQWAW